MNYIQSFDGIVKAKGVTTDTLFYSSLATDGLTIENGIVTAYNGNASSVYIPDFFNGVAVTRIEDSVFSGHTEIVEVRFPKRLEYISAEAFYGCTGLVSVELGDIDLDISPNIESGAFGGCTSLRAVTINAVYLANIASGAFGIASGQVCALYRPISVEDESAWETIANRENLRLSVKYSTKKAFESVKAEQDGNGSNIAETYAERTGTYPNMTVGNATFASKATTTDFTNKTWQTSTNGSFTLTAGTWQIYTTISANPTGLGAITFNVNNGLVYFDGQMDLGAVTPFYFGDALYHIELGVASSGATTATIHGVSGTTSDMYIATLHYREIR